MLDQITPLILTFNEAPNIGRALAKLGWAREILVLDSFSTDETLEIVKSYPSARVVQRKFDNHSAQWNYGLRLCKSSWVLALDADYIPSEDLIRELGGLKPAEAAAFFASFRFCIQGRPLRATLYPPRAILFRRDQCVYEQDGHTQRLRVNGKHSRLAGFVYHDDRKPFSPRRELGLVDKLRQLIVVAPALTFFYTLFGKGLILDGWPGWYYVFQRTLAEMILSLRLIEQKFQAHS
jgi:glycosyltransferase involved in cell wall biosynthesis